MTQILVDAITNISLHSGIIRVQCATIGFDGKLQPSGTLVIPGAVAGKVLQTLISGSQELEKKMREQQANSSRQPGTLDRTPSISAAHQHSRPVWLAVGSMSQ